jgi:hypothetical protein
MENFMITPKVLIRMECILLLSSKSLTRSSELLDEEEDEDEGAPARPRGVYLQSNAEDVAVTISCLVRRYCTREYI